MQRLSADLERLGGIVSQRNSELQQLKGDRGSDGDQVPSPLCLPLPLASNPRAGAEKQA